jgi:hypothetical protein
MEAVGGDWAGWLRGLPASLPLSLDADPELPPGAMVMRSGGQQAIHLSPGFADEGERLVSDRLAEEYRSLAESEPFVVRFAVGCPGIACECCGTQVAQMPEREGGAKQPWKPGIWESDTGRKHTLRRCEWKRANP